MRAGTGIGRADGAVARHWTLRRESDPPAVPPPPGAVRPAAGGHVGEAEPGRLDVRAEPRRREGAQDAGAADIPETSGPLTRNRTATGDAGPGSRDTLVSISVKVGVIICTVGGLKGKGRTRTERNPFQRYSILVTIVGVQLRVRVP